MEMKSLQKRILEVREQIPALSKKNYSEEVNYDFTKIDDIYRYLTPAMNSAGVNMDLVSEKATRTADNGDPVYVSRIEGTNCWLYEADITLVWTNVDDPADKETVTLHAIGTNEMPDKAKGSALTYCLKYYFFIKFAINQGGEDPDMYSMKGETDARKEKGYAAVQDKAGHASKREGKATTVPAAEAGRKSAKTGTADAPGDSHKKITSLEDARNFRCTIGINDGKTMGQIAEDPEKGRRYLEWFLNSYHGKDDRYRQAAAILLESMQGEMPAAA